MIQLQSLLTILIHNQGDALILKGGRSPLFLKQGQPIKLFVPPFEEGTLRELFHSLAPTDELDLFKSQGECSFETQVEEFHLRCKVEKTGGLTLRIKIEGKSPTLSSESPSPHLESSSVPSSTPF